MARKSSGRKAAVALISRGMKKPATADPNEIAEAAYFRWQKRGYGHGNDLADWYSAEREMKKTRK